MQDRSVKAVIAKRDDCSAFGEKFCDPFCSELLSADEPKNGLLLSGIQRIRPRP